MKCIQMTKVDDSKILTQSVMKFLTKQVAKEFDNAEACVTKVRKKSIDTVDVWQLIKANDSTYHIVYILLGYNISKCEMTEEAILNSPKILELHEVLQPSEVDIVKGGPFGPLIYYKKLLICTRYYVILKMIKGRKIMKLQELIQNSKHELDSLNIEEADIKLKILIEYVFKISKEKLILKYKDEINNKKVEEFGNLLKKLENGIPIQYIINNQEFMGLNFYVDEDVLIPQPDTEVLVEEVIKYCNELRNNEPEDKETNKDYKENIEKEPIINKEDKNINKKTIKILDLCTGSGIIGISIYKYLENVEIYASDISQKALNIAEKNTNLNNAKINFINSDMFENIHIKDFDIIVSNPPYIVSKVIKSLSKEVQNEPKLALDGGEDGLKFYRSILENAKDYLRKNGAIFLEIGYDQKEKIEEILKSYKIYKETKCIKDFGGNNRVIIIKK